MELLLLSWGRLGGTNTFFIESVEKLSCPCLPRHIVLSKIDDHFQSIQKTTNLILETSWSDYSFPCLNKKNFYFICKSNLDIRHSVPLNLIKPYKNSVYYFQVYFSLFNFGASFYHTLLSHETNLCTLIDIQTKIMFLF